MSDIRLSFGFSSHPKTKRLIRKIGKEGAWHLVCLMLWIGQNRSDGDLSGMSGEDLELAADWMGEDGAFATALVDCGFIDGTPGSFTVHNWVEHNPWVASSDERSDRARFAGLCSKRGRAFAEAAMPEYAERLKQLEADKRLNGKQPPVELVTTNSSTNSQLPVQLNSTNSQLIVESSPTPSPSPTPNSYKKEAEASPPSDMADEIFAIGKKMLGPKAGGLLGQARKRVGDQKVIEVLAGMSVMKPAVSDPVPYFVKATTPKAREFVC